MAIRKILVPLSGQYDPADAEALERPALNTGIAVARDLGAHLEVFCIEALPAEAHRHLASWVPPLAVDDLLDRIERESDERRERARQLYEAAVKRHRAPRMSKPGADTGFSVNFLEKIGDVRGSLAVRGRLTDLIVTACPPLERHGRVPPLLQIALRETGKPVLISREVACQALPKRVAVAWNGTVEASRAVSLAMDFLLQAEEVIVISVDEGDPIAPDAERLADYLRLHGMQCRTDTVKGKAGDAGDLILERTAAAGAEMLVMGAYTRDRLQRVVFGGATGDVLDRMTVPVLMID